MYLSSARQEQGLGHECAQLLTYLHLKAVIHLQQESLGTINVSEKNSIVILADQGEAGKNPSTILAITLLYYHFDSLPFIAIGDFKIAMAMTGKVRS